MAREKVEALICDGPGCETELHAPASRLIRRARENGWQAREVASLTIDPDDGPDAQLTDRCPAHHVQTVPREVVLAEAGGPGGIQGWMLP